MTWTIFGQAEPLLVTKIGPAGPFLVSQEWFGRTVFTRTIFSMTGQLLCKVYPEFQQYHQTIERSHKKDVRFNGENNTQKLLTR